MNYYEVGTALEEAAKTIKEMPGSTMDLATADVQQRYNAMLKTVADMQEFSQKCVADLKALDDVHTKECERICDAVDSRRKKIRQCMEDIPREDIYMVEKLAEACERLRRIDPEDLNMIVDILHARKAKS
jgi:thiamine pyrophosphate-dependent acetolactate synthase large subunit-like protein